jgi:hypothetical protein
VDPAKPDDCWVVTPAAEATDTQAVEFPGGVAVVWTWIDDVEYSVSPPKALKIKDKCGVESTVQNVPEGFKFKTNKFKVAGISPGGGNAVAPAKKLTITFNQSIDDTTFVEGTDWSLTPHPAGGFGVTPIGNGIVILGDYNLNTNYVFKILAGAQISDAAGKHTLTVAEEQVSNYTTVTSIAVTALTLLSDPTGSFSPATRRAVTANDGAVITKVDDATPVRAQFTFNQEILASSWDANDFTLTTAAGAPVTPAPTITVSGANVRVTSPLPAGSYIFTIKGGSVVTDKIMPPNMYTFANERVIHFTVKVDPPVTPFKCLGAP